MSVTPESQFEPFLLVFDPALDDSCMHPFLGLTDLLLGVAPLGSSLTHSRCWTEVSQGGIAGHSIYFSECPDKNGTVGMYVLTTWTPIGLSTVSGGGGEGHSHTLRTSFCNQDSPLPPTGPRLHLNTALHR